MIVVACANPALDVTYHVDRLELGQVHRVGSPHVRAGGKGTNVARILAQLDHEAMLVAPLGGASGAEFEKLTRGLALRPVTIDGSTRTSVAIVAGSDATVVNEDGPNVTAHEWQRFALAVCEAVSPGDVVVLAGSLPPGAPADGYAQLITLLPSATCLLDTSGAALIAALDACPDVVAPNLREVRDATNRPELSAEAAARLLRESGARVAVVSDGPSGLTALVEDEVLTAAPPRIVAGNPTGAGDALTAALAVGLDYGTAWSELLVDAVAVAAASVACPVAGELDRAVLRELRAP